MSTLHFFDQVPVDILANRSLHKQDLRSYCYRLMINTLFCHSLKNACSFKELNVLLSMKNILRY